MLFLGFRRMTENKRGGPRKGAGPKPKFTETMKSHNVKLDAETVEKARDIGAGNLSEGLRVAVKAYTKGENGTVK